MQTLQSFVIIYLTFIDRLSHHDNLISWVHQLSAMCTQIDQFRSSAFHKDTLAQQMKITVTGIFL